MKTIKEIALIAGVSAGTVDRVIHNRDGVSKKTRSKIIEILKEHNYEKNMIASTLATQKKYSIATLIPEAKNKDDFWEKPKLGILSAIKSIKDYGFSVNQHFFDQLDELSFTNKLNEIINAVPDAVLIAPIFYEQTAVLTKKLEKKNIPYLFININVGGMNNISFIGQNSYQGGLLAAKLMSLITEKTSHLLIVRRKRKVNNHNAIEDRIKGFTDFVKKAHPDRTICQIRLKENNRNENDALTKVLLKDHLIKGIFVPSSFVNIVAKYLIKFDLKEIKLIGYDINNENTKYVKNETISFLITQKPFEQGYSGIKLLADYLLQGKKPKTIHYSPIEIITKENIDYYRY